MNAPRPALGVLLITILVIIAGVMGLAVSRFMSTHDALVELNTQRQYMGCFESGSPTSEEIESRAMIKLPPSARQLAPYSEDFCNTFYLRFQMARSDFTRFIGSTSVGLPMSTRDIPADFVTLPHDLGWHLDGIQTFWAGQATNSYYVHQSIFVDRTDPQQWTVYVVVKDMTD